MADITLSSIVGGGGGFVTKFVSGIILLSSGVSGDVITLTPPSGQKVKLTTIVSSGLENGITITLDGSDVLTSQRLISEDSAFSGDFNVNGTRLTAGEASDIEAISGGINEVLVVKKDTGSTVNNIIYTYQFGA